MSISGYVRRGVTESDQAQEDSVLDNSLKFPNHQRTLNLELYNSKYDQNKMTVKTDF